MIYEDLQQWDRLIIIMRLKRIRLRPIFNHINKKSIAGAVLLLCHIFNVLIDNGFVVSKAELRNVWKKSISKEEQKDNYGEYLWLYKRTEKYNTFKPKNNETNNGNKCERIDSEALKNINRDFIPLENNSSFKSIISVNSLIKCGGSK